MSILDIECPDGRKYTLYKCNGQRYLKRLAVRAIDFDNAYQVDGLSLENMIFINNKFNEMIDSSYVDLAKEIFEMTRDETHPNRTPYPYCVNMFVALELLKLYDGFSLGSELSIYDEYIAYQAEEIARKPYKIDYDFIEALHNRDTSKLKDFTCINSFVNTMYIYYKNFLCREGYKLPKFKVFDDIEIEYTNLGGFINISKNGITFNVYLASTDTMIRAILKLMGDPKYLK